MKTVFGPAIAEMEENKTDWFGPLAFQEYLTSHNIPHRRTAQYISIDSLNRLPKELKEAKTMVFRMGSPTGSSYTHFALAKYVNSWEDYFLFDSSIQKVSDPTLFIPPVSIRQLYSFQLLPKLTETSFVNLALASGLISKALYLDQNTCQLVPATGRSTFTFCFSPHSTINDKWVHENGQVEIDALFIGRRKGQEILFVVEAKMGKKHKSLAKHKLVYPYLALRNKVPNYMRIVPVYLRIWSEDEEKHFIVTECNLTYPANDIASVSSLEINSSFHFILRDF